MQSPILSSSPRLGSYLPCPSSELQAALDLQTKSTDTPRKRIGTLLVETGAITAEQLNESLSAQRLDRLRKCALFSNFPRGELIKLSGVFEERTIEAGEVFIKEDEADSYLFVLASGELEVFSIENESEEIPIARLYAGEPVGELGYVTGGRRTASVRTLRRCEMLRTEYDSFRSLLEAMPRLSQAFLDIAVKRLIQTSELYTEKQERLKLFESSMEELTDLLDLSIAAGEGGVESLLERLVRTARYMLGAERGTLFMVDEGSGGLWSKVLEGAEVREIKVPKGCGIAGWVAEHKEVLNIEDAYQDFRFSKEADQATGYVTKSVLCAPIWSPGNHILGVVQLVNKRLGKFGSHDETLIRAFASQAATALENYKLHSRVVESRRRMAMLLELGNTIGNTLDLRTLIRQVVKLITDALECERTSFFVVDEMTRELWSLEFQGDELQEIRFPINTGLAGECATQAETIMVDDAYADSRFNPDIDRKTGFRTRTILCVPVVNRNKKTTGVIECMNKLDGRFTNEDAKLLRALCSQVSIALDNAHLHAQEVETRSYLERVQSSISSAIVTLDEDHGVVVANPAARKLLKTEVTGDADIRDILGEGNQAILSMVSDAYRDRRPINRDDVQLHHIVDDVSTVNVSVAPLEDADNLFKGLVLVLDDITQEKRVRGAFGQYLAPAVIEDLLANPDKLQLGGEKRELTAMFTDIEGFTALAEGVEPEALVTVLHEYFDMACSVILRHGGTIDKIVGDALHVFFNAPVQVPDHADRAVRCAVELSWRSQQLIERQHGRGLALGRTRIGINSGTCVVGNFGGSDRFDYTAHGDAINTAARLEGANKHLGTSICVSETTVTQCSDELGFRPIGRLQLKGKRGGVSVFEPIDPAQEHLPKTRAYREAYARLASRDPEADSRFRELASEFGDDPLIRLHVERLKAGQQGVDIVLDAK